MMRWVRDLPLYAVSDRYLLVHSGMEELPADGNASPDCIENGFLVDGVNRTGHWQIVGHLPVGNLAPGQLIPLVRKEQQVIGIDGGINTHALEQLNALICTPEGFSYMFEDRYEARAVIKNYAPEPLPEPPLLYRWSDRDVDILRDDGPFRYCRTKGGREGYVKTESLLSDETGTHVTTCTLAELLPVKAGDVVKLLDASAADYFLVKNATGRMGYVPASVIGGPVTPPPSPDVFPLCPSDLRGRTPSAG